MKMPPLSHQRQPAIQPSLAIYRSPQPMVSEWRATRRRKRGCQQSLCASSRAFSVPFVSAKPLFLSERLTGVSWASMSVSMIPSAVTRESKCSLTRASRRARIALMFCNSVGQVPMRARKFVCVSDQSITSCSARIVAVGSSPVISDISPKHSPRPK